MGVDIHVRVACFNRDKNQYENITLYRKDEKDKLTSVDLSTGRDHDLFEILQHGEGFPSRALYVENLPKELKDEIEECQNISGYYGFYEANLADMKNYLYRHPLVRDYDWEDEETFEEKGWKDNPVKHLVDRIEWAISFADQWWLGWNSPSDYRVLFWFDH